MLYCKAGRASASTIRTWCERGELAGAYKLHGREWRVPLSAIEAMQRKHAAQHQPPATGSTEKPVCIGEWRKYLPSDINRGP